MYTCHRKINEMSRTIISYPCLYFHWPRGTPFKEHRKCAKHQRYKPDRPYWYGWSVHCSYGTYWGRQSFHFFWVRILWQNQMPRSPFKRKFRCTLQAVPKKRIADIATRGDPDRWFRQKTRKWWREAQIPNQGYRLKTIFSEVTQIVKPCGAEISAVLLWQIVVLKFWNKRITTMYFPPHRTNEQEVWKDGNCGNAFQKSS